MLTSTPGGGIVNVISTHRAQIRHTEPNDDTCGRTHSEKEGKALPVVTGVVDDGLDDVGADHRRRTVGQPEESEELGEY